MDDITMAFSEVNEDERILGYIIYIPRIDAIMSFNPEGECLSVHERNVDTLKSYFKYGYYYDLKPDLSIDPWTTQDGVTTLYTRYLKESMVSEFINKYPEIFRKCKDKYPEVFAKCDIMHE